jgi:NodT family efflux transporter outer membrane factor (OMF) lipoprotein
MSTAMTLRPIAWMTLAAALCGCAVGPDYKRPPVATPPAYKEAEGWTKAEPADAAPRGDWWTIFNDPLLNQLEAQVVVSNQNLAAAEAAYRQAHDTVAEQRAALFPTLSLTGSATRSGRGGPATIVSSGGGGVSIVPKSSSTFQIGGGASWEPDLWGKVRRTVESAKANAEASDADLANARLSAQSELAVDYIQLRADDEQKRLLDLTVDGYKRSLKIATDQYNAGLTAKNDMLTAQSQLANTQAQAVDLMRQRATLEHAIAVLVGQAPASFSIATTDWTLTVPDTPVSVPSLLLQRRPDIASAERRMAAANAQIGVQTAAFFPTLNLTGQYGFSSGSLGSLIGSSTSLWSLGATAAETVLDFGARQARVRESRAAYDQSVAQYRQTVLSAFQEVEDDLAAVRVLSQELPLRREASQDADQAERIAINQYKAGIADYTTVVVAQAAALSARQSLLTTQSSMIAAATQLITAMGGGWNATEMRS